MEYIDGESTYRKVWVAHVCGMRVAYTRGVICRQDDGTEQLAVFYGSRWGASAWVRPEYVIDPGRC